MHLLLYHITLLNAYLYTLHTHTQAGPMAGKLDRSSNNGLIFCPCKFHSAWQRPPAPELEQISLVLTSPCRSITHVPKSFGAMNAKPANQGVSILASNFWKVASFKGQCR